MPRLKSCLSCLLLLSVLPICRQFEFQGILLTLIIILFICGFYFSNVLNQQPIKTGGNNPFRSRKHLAPTTASFLLFPEKVLEMQK